MALRELPPLDAVLISHDHYDHLDMETIRNLVDLQAAPFLVPLGVGAHLERWGVPATRIIELDWNERATVAGVEFIATAARHFSGRGFTRDETLWAVLGDQRADPQGVLLRRHRLLPGLRRRSARSTARST